MSTKFNQYFKIVIALLLIVCVTGENAWSENIPLSTNALDFFLGWLTIFLVFVCKRKTESSLDKGTHKLLIYYFIWSIFTWFRGFYMAVDYFSYRSMFFSVPIMLLPLFFYIFTNPANLSFFLNKWVKFSLPLFLGLAFVIGVDAYGFYLAPVTLLTVFLFSAKHRWRVVLLIVTFFAIFADLSARSNVIKFILPVLLSLAFLFRGLISEKLLKVAGIVCILAPFILIPLAAFGGFNILQDSGYTKEYTSARKGANGSEDLFEDTRTFIYYEVIESAIENNYVLWGRTPARGNDTKTLLFDEFNEEHHRKVSERFSNEIGAANTFTHYGLIGLIIMLLIYYRSAYLALYKSRSYYMKLIGVAICFRSFFFFLEDYYSFRIQTFTLVFLIGMGLSEKFRQMTDGDFKIWINRILK